MSRTNRISRTQVQFVIYSVLCTTMLMVLAELAAYELMELWRVPLIPQFLIAALIGFAVVQGFERTVVRPMRDKLRER